MPAPALTMLDATLDAAAAIADTLLSTSGGPHLRRRALQRAGVVLCATAWETYVEDTLIWVAGRAGESVQRPEQLTGSPATAHLAVLAEEARVELRRAFETTRWKKGPPPGDEAGARAFVEVKAADEVWLDKLERGPWAELLEMDLRRQVLGLHYWDGPGRHNRAAMPQPGFKTVATWQERIYGTPLIEQVRLPGHNRDYVAKWLDVLVDVRNASVHRGETPGRLDTGGVRFWIGFVHDLAHELDRHIERWADLHLPVPRQ